MDMIEGVRVDAEFLVLDRRRFPAEMGRHSVGIGKIGLLSVGIERIRPDAPWIELWKIAGTNIFGNGMCIVYDM
ncbi:MAG: hypothetical protein PHE53_05395 [Thermoguttaceae bacterium]|nr:hypothetical protein [Thermoguttaceae bacterium]